MFYTYLVGWSKLDKFYYGVRYAANSSPSELWKTYFTSSNHVKKFREENGEPDLIQVRKIFNNPNKARLWENKVLKRIDVVNNGRFLNKTDNISIDPIAALSGSIQSTNKGAVRNDVAKRNAKMVGEKNHMFGKTGKDAPCFGRIGKKHPMFGKRNPAASEAAKRKIECPHCNKTGNVSNMKRWHFNNCKSLKTTNHNLGELL